MHDGLGKARVRYCNLRSRLVAFLGLAIPFPVSGTELGSNWQCNKAAFVMTTCTQVH